MKQFTKVMKALSDPGRVKVVKMLEGRELCVCDIQAVLGLAQPTVSKHLKILEDAGLIQGRKQGSWVHYSLTDGSESVYAAVLLEHLPAWLNNDEEILEIVTSLSQSRRKDTCKTG
ncbi:MAG: ArsR/SmtB family transcription factor [Desulfovibrionales bacterium]